MSQQDQKEIVARGWGKGPEGEYIIAEGGTRLPLPYARKLRKEGRLVIKSNSQAMRSTLTKMLRWNDPHFFAGRWFADE